MSATPLKIVNGDVRLAADTRGKGPNLVFTTGWANERSVWNQAADDLASDHRITTWDLRGHGDSDVPPPGFYKRSHALEDLAAVLNTSGKPAILVGHSLGGYLSLAYALDRPEEVNALVLIATGPGFRKLESRQEWNDTFTAAAVKLGLPEGVEGLSLHTDSMVIDRLSEITVPVLIIIGEKDRRFIAAAEVFERYLDVHKTVVVDEAGHMVHTKEAKIVATTIRSFVANLN
tara:strand:+ start:915 stop:1610 length:696 start_codon:yes stop_codon:yes gene_type:complete